MTNFYEDFAFSPEDFEQVSSILNNTAGKLMEYILPLNDLRVSRHLEDFRIVPVQYFDISSALYNIGTIFDSEELKVWDSCNKSEKVDMLHNKGKYIRFVADRGFPAESGDIPEQYDIINFKLYDPDGNRLVHNTDYIYKNNCLYLLDYATWDIRNGKHFKMIDAAIDFDTTKDMLGQNLELTHRPTKMSKSEFNEIMRALTMSMIKGGTMNGVANGLSELNNGSSDGIKIIDKLQNNEEISDKWARLPGESDYSPFDFVIYYPASFSEYKVELLKTYLNKVKHSYTKYTELAYDSHEEKYGEVTFEWWDSLLRPFIDTKGYAAIENKDELLYHVIADQYYVKDEFGNIILEAHLKEPVDPTDVLSAGENNIPVTVESARVGSDCDSDFEDRFTHFLGSTFEPYKTLSDISDQETEDTKFAIGHALTNDWYSRVSVNMMLY